MQSAHMPSRIAIRAAIRNCADEDECPESGWLDVRAVLIALGLFALMLVVTIIGVIAVILAFASR